MSVESRCLGGEPRGQAVAKSWAAGHGRRGVGEEKRGMRVPIDLV